jgi:hypothetical protein
MSVRDDAYLQEYPLVAMGPAILFLSFLDRLMCAYSLDLQLIVRCLAGDLNSKP